MRMFRSWAPAAVFAFAVLHAQPTTPAPQAYEGKFECAIPATGNTCTVAADSAIPAGKRIKLDSVKARIVVSSRTRSPFEAFIDVGDPAAEGGVRSIKITPTQSGRTEGGFFSIWTVNEKLDSFAYKTANCPAPKFRLSNPEPDPLKLLNGAVQDGVVSGSVVGLE
jgi:hypothetical protein